MSQTKNLYCSRRPNKWLSVYTPADIQSEPDYWELKHGYIESWTTAESRQKREALENLPVRRSQMQRLASSKRCKKKLFKKNTKHWPIPSLFRKTASCWVLSPILDEDGLLWSDGSRLRYADYLPFNARYPVIPPKKSGVTRLIVKSYHERSNHAAETNHTLSLLSARFSIM